MIRSKRLKVQGWRVVRDQFGNELARDPTRSQPQMIAANFFAPSDKFLSSPNALTPNSELGLEFNTHVDYRAARTDGHIHHIP